MSNIDKQRIAAARTLEARSDAEFKTIADARHKLRAMQVLPLVTPCALAVDEVHAVGFGYDADRARRLAA